MLPLTLGVPATGLVEDGQPYGRAASRRALFAIGLLLAGAVVAGLAYLGVTHEDRWRPAGLRPAIAPRVAALVAVAVALVILAFVVASRSIAHGRLQLPEFTNPVTLGPAAGRSDSADFGSNSRWPGGARRGASGYNPVAGTGAGNVLAGAKAAQYEHDGSTEPHNLPLQFSSPNGLVGFLLAAGAAGFRRRSGRFAR